jgi:hypothetical protein
MAGFFIGPTEDAEGDAENNTERDAVKTLLLFSASSAVSAPSASAVGTIIDRSSTSLAFQDRVAGKRWGFGMTEVNRKENRQRHRLAAELGGHEAQLARAGDRRRIERGVAAGLLTFVESGTAFPSTST